MGSKCLVLSTNPSGNVPSTWISCNNPGTLGRTWLRPRSVFPCCISSATECCPSRIRSWSWEAMSAVASVWFSWSPRARRFWANEPAYVTDHRCSMGYHVAWLDTWCKRILASSRGKRCIVDTRGNALQIRFDNVSVKDKRTRTAPASHDHRVSLFSCVFSSVFSLFSVAPLLVETHRRLPAGSNPS